MRLRPAILVNLFVFYFYFQFGIQDDTCDLSAFVHI
jgi:hypothetical protein